MEEEIHTIRPHAIMFPLPLQGHVIPFAHLAVNLASKGFTITFVNTHSIHHQITTSHEPNTDVGNGNIFATARESGLDIRYATISDGFPLGFDRFRNTNQFCEGLLHVFSAHVDELVGNMVRSTLDPPITCLVADTFFTWTSMIAQKYKLVNVSFWTEPALVYTLYYHLDLLKINGHFACQDAREDTIDYIPGVGTIEPSDLMSYLQASDTSTVLHRIICKAFDQVRQADLVLCNTVEELESRTISAIHEKQKFYAIGPVFPTHFHNYNKTMSIATSMRPECDCIPWLANSDGPILYVSFGSYVEVGKSDLVELALGLLLSNVKFIWVLRPDVVGSGVIDFLPIGYEDEIRDKGLIVPWCRQVEVISHPSIRGFLTHCGWNSILESIWCGVPLLCYPIITDQITNRKLVVDDWKIGNNLCDGKGKKITKEQVAKNINCLMNGESALKLRKNTIRIRKMFEKALAFGGSSETSFNQFIHDVKAKIQAKKRK